MFETKMATSVLKIDQSTHKVKTNALFSSVQFSSVQFKRVSVRSEKLI